MLEHNGAIVKGEGFIIDDFTNHGINVIEKHKEHPFFLYLPFNTPHSPMQVPAKFWNNFKTKELAMRNRNSNKEDIPFTRAALAMCENIDWNVGRIVDKVEELGVSENTIIIYLSDNGPNGVRWNAGMNGKKRFDRRRSSYFLNWISTTDSITFNVEVLTQWDYEVELFYTCPQEAIGSELELSFKEAKLAYKINEAFNPPLLTNNDVYPRAEGFVKQFKNVKMGTIFLQKKRQVC